MKLGVAYNVFDNEELLEDSILRIRNYADHVAVLFQEVSNVGNKCSDELVPFLKNLKSKGLIDRLIKYTPDLTESPEVNERIKNNVCLDISRQANCDYHMGMACDEFYFDELGEILVELEKNPVDIVTSYMYTYYKSSSYRFDTIEDYVVPILHKVYPDRNFEQNAPMPLLIDPTRRMKYDTCKCLSKENPIMHHLSHVRKDYGAKLYNSTANVNWYDRIPKMIEYYNNWKPGDDAYVHSGYEKLIYTDKFKKEIIF